MDCWTPLIISIILLLVGILLIILLIQHLVNKLLDRVQYVTDSIQDNVREVLDLTNKPYEKIAYPPGMPSFKQLRTPEGYSFLALTIQSVINWSFGKNTFFPNFITIHQTLGEKRGAVLDTPEYRIVSYRGTRSTSDVIRDFQAYQRKTRDINNNRIPGFTHGGFESLLSEFEGDLRYVLEQLNGRKVIFTGHSLGGALAVLSAMKLQPRIGSDRLAVITFGTPRFGDKDFFEEFQRRCPDYDIIVNMSDIVPQFPPSVFVDVSGRWFYFFGDGIKRIDFQTGSLIGNHSILNHVRYFSSDPRGTTDSDRHFVW